MDQKVFECLDCHGNVSHNDNHTCKTKSFGYFFLNLDGAGNNDNAKRLDFYDSWYTTDFAVPNEQHNEMTTQQYNENSESSSQVFSPAENTSDDDEVYEDQDLDTSSTMSADSGPSSIDFNETVGSNQDLDSPSSENTSAGPSNIDIDTHWCSRSRRFVCPTCGKGFTCKSKFVRHWRIHSGEKPFICSECGRGFSQKYHLMSHLRAHTGEKPFSCHICEKNYTRKSTFQAHLRRKNCKI